MSAKTSTESLFDQAADTYVKAFKSCVNLQEEMAKKCFDLVQGCGQGEDWSKKYQDFIGQIVPNMQKAAEESMKLVEQNSSRCMELLSEGFATVQAPSATEAQERLQKLWESSLDAMRESSENVVKLSSEALQAYADFMKGQTETAKQPATAAK